MAQDALFQSPAQPPPLPVAPVLPYPVMGETGAGQGPVLTCSFPKPPDKFIQLYTDDNVNNGTAPAPPGPIVDGSPFVMFGSQMTSDDTIIRSLEAQGMRRLYPREFDHKRELKKMNHSILFNFVDLIDVLAKCPDTGKREEKLNDILTLFFQMHHLINELRPHQARETIKVTLDLQTKERFFTTISMNAQIEKVETVISKSLERIPDTLLHVKSLILQDLQRLEQLCQEQKPETVATDPADEMMELDGLMCNIVDDS